MHPSASQCIPASASQCISVHLSASQCISVHPSVPQCIPGHPSTSQLVYPAYLNPTARRSQTQPDVCTGLYMRAIALYVCTCTNCNCIHACGRIHTHVNVLNGREHIQSSPDRFISSVRWEQYGWVVVDRRRVWSLSGLQHTCEALRLAPGGCREPTYMRTWCTLST